MRINTAPNTSSTIPNVPVTVPEKYKNANIAAAINLIILSVDPMFFFIMFYFKMY